MMLKKWVCAVLMLMLLTVNALAADGNLVKNPSFEDGDGMDGWALTAWEKGDVFTSFEIDTDGTDGGYCASLYNYEQNDSRFQQDISVEGNTVYRFSAKIKAEGIGGDGDIGASLSVMDTFVSSVFISDTDDEWIDVEFYAKTEKKQTSIKLAARLGYYGALCSGRAWFDEIRVEKVDEEEAKGIAARSLATNKPGSSGSDVEEPDRAGINYLTLAVIFGFFAAFVLYRVSTKRINISERAAFPILVGILAVGAAVRLYIAYTVPGYETDMRCFAGWGGRLLAVGPWEFYSEDYFCDYPPGYIMVCALFQGIANMVGAEYEGGLHQLLIKLPPIICDLILCGFLYRIAVRHVKSNPFSVGLMVALLCALSPAVIGDSAAWGQIDSVLTLFMVLSVYAMTQGRLRRASVFFSIALLIKPQALMFGPVLLLAFIGAIWENPKKGLKELGISFGICAALCLAVILPHTGGRSILWIWDLYAGTLGSYQYATVNAMNLFAFMGGNWVAQEATAFLLTWEAWGMIFMIASILFAVVLFLKKREPRTLLLSAIIIIVGVFAFGVRMHERYLFPVLFLLPLAAFLYQDRRFLHVFIAFTIQQTVNILLVLAHPHLNQGDSAMIKIFSFVTIAAAIYCFTICLDIVSARPKQFPLTREKRLPRMVVSVEYPTLKSPGTRGLRFTRLDAILLVILTLAYSVLAFINLGDTIAPETKFRASAANEYIVFDLGQECDLSRFYYYGEITGGSMELSFSNDGINFSDEIWIDYCNTDSTANTMFKWLVEDLGRNGRPQTAQYARLNFESAGLSLFEVGFTDDQGSAYPVRIRERDGGRDNLRQDPNLLVDEQVLIPVRPTYMNSMYFDEIYHARTGYEQVHEMKWYETTHPPLGKVFISWSIELLGMNPFAWRLPGTIAGILMLPGMYLLGKLLFKRTELAFAVTAMLAFDCMHFTQTRIATIDSYPVLFIIWSFFFMFLYANMSFYHEKFLKTLIPLAASGLFMGLACASKWIGFYSAAGLAVVFFMTLLRRFKEYREARKSGEEEFIERTRRFKKYALITCLCCLVFFIAIPALIYLGSYYQYLAVPNSGNNLEGVWNYQTGMFNYHKAVFDEHPYESTWYQWPVIWKPMAFFFDYRMSPGWTSAISTFGNPAIWWAGLVAMLWMLYRWLRGDARRDLRVLLVVVGFLAQYLPWVLVPRTTFIYHYFASVPFIILAIGFFLETQLARGKKGMRVITAYLIVCGLLFALFYPVASGMEIPIDFAKLTAWLPSWHLYWGN